jgi:hypothetical protein
MIEKIKIVPIVLSLLLGACTVLPEDRIYSVDSELGCMGYEDIRPYKEPKVWITSTPRNQSFLSRLKYTYKCLDNYSYGRGWIENPNPNE